MNNFDSPAIWSIHQQGIWMGWASDEWLPFIPYLPRCRGYCNWPTIRWVNRPSINLWCRSPSPPSSIGIVHALIHTTGKEQLTALAAFDVLRDNQLFCCLFYLLSFWVWIALSDCTLNCIDLQICFDCHCRLPSSVTWVSVNLRVGVRAVGCSLCSMSCLCICSRANRVRYYFIQLSRILSRSYLCCLTTLILFWRWHACAVWIHLMHVCLFVLLSFLLPLWIC